MNNQADSVSEHWREFLAAHPDKIPTAWKANPNIISITGDEPLDLLIEGLKTRCIPATGFKINIALGYNATIEAKIIEIFKTIEEYDQYYSLELEKNDSKNLFKALQSEKCKINTFKYNLLLYAKPPLAFKKFLKKNTSVTDLDLILSGTTISPADFKRHTSIALSALKKNNRTVQRLELGGIADESAISDILAENHTITSLELQGHGLKIGKPLLLAMANMGSLKAIKIRSAVPYLPAQFGSLSETIRRNKFLEKITFFDRYNDTKASDEHNKLLAEAIVTHPSLRRLTLPGASICPLIKTISTSNTIDTLELPLKKLMKDEEMQESLLSMKSLRKLIFRIRGPTESQGQYLDMDLSNLVHPASPIQTLVLHDGLRYKPVKPFTEILANDTSIRLVKMKGSFYYWPQFYYASAENPFMKAHYTSRGYADKDQFRELTFCRLCLMLNFAKAIKRVTVLRTIYLSKDRGLFATLPNEILLLIWYYAFYYDESTLWKRFSYVEKESQIKKLVSIANDRSKLGNEPDVRKRLQSLWKDETFAEFVRNNKF